MKAIIGRFDEVLAQQVSKTVFSLYQREAQLKYMTREEASKEN
jgi:hypothetical protein